MTAQYSLREIVEKLGGEVAGENVRVSRVASLANAVSGTISFFVDTKYRSALESTGASAVIINPGNAALTDIPCIVTENPYAYFAKLSELFNPPEEFLPGIHPSAVIANSAIVPASCSIGANAVIEEHVRLGEHVVVGAGCIVGSSVEIGDYTRLHARVVIYRDCQIGQHCTFLAGSVVGADGFGYAPQDGKWVKIPQVGRVVIGDWVDVGVNTCIDRGALDDTVIEEGAKLDNLIQIGHNCQIGAHTVIAGCVGIAGSAKIGKNCRIGGAAMILGHLEVADGVTISPGSMITRSLSQTDTYTALMPFQTHDKWLKTAANLRHLPDMYERIRQLEKELQIIKQIQDKT